MHRRRRRTPSGWADIVEGLPDPIVKEGMIDIIERPGMGVDLIPERAVRYLSDDDRGFFDRTARGIALGEPAHRKTSSSALRMR
jgi:hypothetical protein